MNDKVTLSLDDATEILTYLLSKTELKLAAKIVVAMTKVSASEGVAIVTSTHSSK